MASKKVVHIIGTGTIGEPLIGLFAEKKDRLGFDEVTFHKRTPLLTDRSKVINLIKRGARLAWDESARQGFRGLGIEPSYEHHEALRQVAGCGASSTPDTPAPLHDLLYPATIGHYFLPLRRKRSKGQRMRAVQNSTQTARTTGDAKQKL